MADFVLVLPMQLHPDCSGRRKGARGATHTHTAEPREEQTHCCSYTQRSICLNI